MIHQPPSVAIDKANFSLTPKAFTLLNNIFRFVQKLLIPATSDDIEMLLTVLDRELSHCSTCSVQHMVRFSRLQKMF